MSKSKLISIAFMATLTIMGVTYLFINSDEAAIANNGEVKEVDLVMYLFNPEIIKAIKQQYELEEDSSIGYGLENIKIKEFEESDSVGYHVLVDVEGFYQDSNESKLKTEIRDTLKFSVTSDEYSISMKLIEYSSNGWE
ncbi:hypothetical protein [Halalkalibacter akibai]|uniref:Uncharacterized protein n=1 Tax=Halalkalibacter akibai (strain ATCC 43226 / DSM 21942 / CIP 109018 / JCM 9157 / 1139) TaxID=1236973 RepID=W4R040_HALA3|nr:hypothetical protein [Halalkalibacter akibai]GAE37711.1 hypothetical protein JCM9157_5030 [Halalkalibacter akibai JCM 9157]